MHQYSRKNDIANEHASWNRRWLFINLVFIFFYVLYKKNIDYLSTKENPTAAPQIIHL